MLSMGLLSRMHLTVRVRRFDFMEGKCFHSPLRMPSPFSMRNHAFTHPRQATPFVRVH
jgi:hypothetical protein